MEKLYVLLILGLINIYCVKGASVDLIDGKIKITVGTTSGCSDTVRFVGTLAEVYADYKEFLEVEFVPWGRTRYNEDGSMWCQFGQPDCFANRVHRCALDLLKGNQDAQMAYMLCEFSGARPAFLQGSYQCALNSGINLVNIDTCMFSGYRALDDAAQEAAREPMEVINFVPTVHFNDVVDLRMHTNGFNRLRSVICFALAEHEFTGVTSCYL